MKDQDLEKINFSKIIWAQKTVAKYDEVVSIKNVVLREDFQFELSYDYLEGRKHWKHSIVIMLKNSDIDSTKFFASETDLTSPHAKSLEELYNPNNTKSLAKRALAISWHNWHPKGGEIIGFLMYAPDKAGCGRQRSNIVFYRLPSIDGSIKGVMVARYSQDDNSLCDAHKPGMPPQRDAKFEWIRTKTIGDLHPDVITYESDLRELKEKDAEKDAEIENLKKSLEDLNLEHGATLGKMQEIQGEHSRQIYNHQQIQKELAGNVKDKCLEIADLTKTRNRLFKDKDDLLITIAKVRKGSFFLRGTKPKS